MMFGTLTTAARTPMGVSLRAGVARRARSKKFYVRAADEASAPAQQKKEEKEEEVPIKFSSSSREGEKLEARQQQASDRGFLQPTEWGSFMDPFDMLPRLTSMHPIEMMNRMFHQPSQALLPDAGNLFRTMDRIMDQQMSSLMHVPSRMQLDVGSDKGSYVIDAMVPGLKKENVRVSLANNRLRVAAEHDEEQKAADEGVTWARRTIHRSWSEEFALPENADLSPDAIHAKLEDGILRIRINKIQTDEEQEEEEAKNTVRVPIE